MSGNLSSGAATVFPLYRRLPRRIRLQPFQVEFSTNRSLLTLPTVELLVDVDLNGSYSLSKQMTVVSISSNNEWRANYTPTTLMPSTGGVPDDIMPWKVVITTQDTSGPVFVTNSDADANTGGDQSYSMHIDQVLPQLSTATKTGNSVQIQFDGAMKASSLSTTDFRLNGDAAYTATSIDTSQASSGIIVLNFNNLGVSGSWSLFIISTIQDAAGNSTMAGAVSVN